MPKNISPLPNNLLNKNIFFMYIYSIFWEYSLLSLLQMVSFFFFFPHTLITLQLVSISKITFPKYIVYNVLSHTHRFFKYTDIFYLFLTKETFIFFKTEAMKQMGITVCEKGKQFPEQKMKQNNINK